MTEQVFVARERELAKLRSLLDRTLAGHGQVCFVTGEAGAGKTALVTEFARRAQVQHEDLLVAVGMCNAHTGIGDPYLPFREVLGMLTGDVETRLAQGIITRENASRLQAFLRVSGQALVDLGPDLIDILIPGAGLATRAGTFLAGKALSRGEARGISWLSRLEALTERKAALAAGPSLDQDRIFQQYTQVLQALAAQAPLLVVLDDLQWADISSIGLLFHLGRSIAESRILIIGTYRSEDVALGRGDGRHPLEPVMNELKRYYGDVWVELDQSEEIEDQQFVDALLDSEPNRLDEDFRQALFQHTRGHALFTVELLRNMQERGDLLLDQAGRWVEAPALAWDGLPARVEGVIEERIGRLEAELREALTIASVEGEDFTAEVVARVQTLDERGIVRLLSNELDKRHHLVRERGIRRLGTQRLSLYRFRHNLFQKYLYDSLGEVERSYLHEDVGNVLEALYADQTEEIVAIAGQLAWHFQEAGITEKAVDYLLQAGRQAVRLSAYQEASDHLNKGLTSLETLPDTPERTERELDIHTVLGQALMATRGYADPEVERVYRRARELSHETERASLLSVALAGLWTFHVVRGGLPLAKDLAEQTLTLAQREQDSALLLQADQALGITLCALGDFAPARHYLQQGIARYDPQQHNQLVFRYGGADLRVSCRTFLVWVLWLLGYPDQALEMSEEMLSLAEGLGHPFSLAYALCGAAQFHQFRQEPEATEQQADAVIALSTEQKFPFWHARGMVLRGWALTQGQQPEEGIAQIRRGLDMYQTIGAGTYRPNYLALLASAQEKLGRAEQALALLDEALAVAEENEERYYEAELHRLRGELRLKQGGRDGPRTTVPTGEAEACFWKAIEVARQQEAKSWELRAVMSLCRLWRDQDKRDEAQEMLTEIYGWFTEGFDTADLKEAKTLLEELSP